MHVLLSLQMAEHHIYFDGGACDNGDSDTLGDNTETAQRGKVRVRVGVELRLVLIWLEGTHKDHSAR